MKHTIERTSNSLPPIHPGEYLREALEDLGLTQAALAKSLGVSAMRISYLMREERPVTAEMALRLGQAFGQSPQYWLNLQADYDLKIAKAQSKKGHTMSIISVHIDKALVEAARTAAKAEFRTVQGQVEFWARVGRAALDNPDLPVSFIAESLMSLAEPREDAQPFPLKNHV